MRSRLLIGLSALPLLILIPTSGATAATSKCPVIVDPTGDATAPPVISNGLLDLLTPNVAAYDIVSADIASTNSLITMVIRVSKLATKVNSSPTGIFWRFDFTGSTGHLFGEVVSDSNSSIGGPAGVSAYIGNVDGTAHLIHVEKPLLDFKHNEVHLRVPMRDFGNLTPSPQTPLTALTASGGRWYDLPGFTLGETDDTATTDNTYILGRTACIKA